MGQSGQAACLILIFRIEKVDDVLRREPLIELAALVAECILLGLAAREVGDAVLQHAAAIHLSIAESARGGDPVGWDALILREASGCLGQQNENFTVHVDAGREAEEVCFEVVHPAAPVADGVKAVGQELGGGHAERLVAARVNRHERPPDGVHPALVDGVLDRAEVEIDPAGVALQCHAVERRHQVADVLFFDRLIRAIPRVLCCACRLVADLSAELVEYCHGVRVLKSTERPAASRHEADVQIFHGHPQGCLPLGFV